MSDWWTRKLSGGPTPESRPPSAPPSQVPYRPYPTTPNPQVNYDAGTDQTTVSRARSSRMSERCPECNSGNYFAPQGTTRMRCYDCGYPIQQSGSGGGLPSDSSGPATPARQVASSGFNPNIIVDRIS